MIPPFYPMIDRSHPNSETHWRSPVYGISKEREIY
jgi:hypothetical protein